MARVPIKTIRDELKKFYGRIDTTPPGIYMVTFIIFLSSIYGLIDNSLLHSLAALVAIWGILSKNKLVCYALIAWLGIDIMTYLVSASLGFWRTVIYLFIAITVFLYIADEKEE